LDDVFAIQTDIAMEVAAALRLTLHHQQRDGTFRYASALTRLDHIGVEKLVLARAQINRYSKAPVELAIKSLNELNQTYPQTPEILGLLSYAHAVAVSVSSFKDEYSRITERDLALQALSLDKTNLDALTTLYYYYSQFAEFRGQAKQLAQDIINYYPELPVGYRIRFSQLVTDAASCQQLQSAVEGLPQGIFPSRRLAALKQVTNSCTSHRELSANGIEVRETLYRIVRELGLKQDGYYQVLQTFAQRNPNPRFLSQTYCRQLMMGADEMAAQTFERLDNASPGYWQLVASLCRYSSDRTTVLYPSQYMQHFAQAYNNNTDLAVVAALVKQLNQGHGDIDNTILTQYLDKVPAFKIDLSTRDYALGLMVLQYYATGWQQSLNTASQLLVQLNEYQQNNPDAYQFWSLGRIHFATALYANELEQAAQILSSGFAPNEAYWLHDKPMMSVVLAPWQGHPLVEDYMQRIDDDALRAKEKFGLY
jgi:hypothetical protein